MRSVLTTLALLLLAAPLTLAQDAAIINAVKWADYAELQRLLDAGADPTALDGDGKTPADLAREKGYYAIARLIEKAARGG